MTLCIENQIERANIGASIGLQLQQVLRPRNIAYCFKVLLAEKFLSSNVQILFRKKLEVIDKIIPIVEACIYQKFETIPFVNIIETI